MELNLTTIIVAAISALSGGFAGNLIGRKRDNFQKLFDQQNEINNQLKKDLDKANQMIDDLRQQIDEQALQILEITK